MSPSLLFKQNLKISESEAEKWLYSRSFYVEKLESNDWSRDEIFDINKPLLIKLLIIINSCPFLLMILFSFLRGGGGLAPLLDAGWLKQSVRLFYVDFYDTYGNCYTYTYRTRYPAT